MECPNCRAPFKRASRSKRTYKSRAAAQAKVEASTGPVFAVVQTKTGWTFIALDKQGNQLKTLKKKVSELTKKTRARARTAPKPAARKKPARKSPSTRRKTTTRRRAAKKR